MAILWDVEKNKKLTAERGLSFELFSSLIAGGQYLEMTENTARRNQMIFVVPYNGYTHIVPFVVDKQKNIVLKTIYPSRKFHKLYGGMINAANP